jgi:hypothetical protein
MEAQVFLEKQPASSINKARVNQLMEKAGKVLRSRNNVVGESSDTLPTASVPLPIPSGTITGTTKIPVATSPPEESKSGKTRGLRAIFANSNVGGGGGGGGGGGTVGGTGGSHLAGGLDTLTQYEAETDRICQEENKRLMKKLKEVKEQLGKMGKRSSSSFLCLCLFLLFLFGFLSLSFLLLSSLLLTFVFLLLLNTLVEMERATQKRLEKMKEQEEEQLRRLEYLDKESKESKMERKKDRKKKPKNRKIKLKLSLDNIVVGKQLGIGGKEILLSVLCSLLSGLSVPFHPRSLSPRTARSFPLLLLPPILLLIPVFLFISEWESGI